MILDVVWPLRVVLFGLDRFDWMEEWVGYTSVHHDLMRLLPSASLGLEVLNVDRTGAILNVDWK